MTHKIGGALLIAEQAPMHLPTLLLSVALTMVVIVLLDRIERTR